MKFSAHKLAVDFAKTRNEQFKPRRVAFYERLFSQADGNHAATRGIPFAGSPGCKTEILLRQIHAFYKNSLG